MITFNRSKAVCNERERERYWETERGTEKERERDRKEDRDINKEEGKKYRKAREIAKYWRRKKQN